MLKTVHPRLSQLTMNDDVDVEMLHRFLGDDVWRADDNFVDVATGEDGQDALV